MADLYHILGLRKNASAASIKKAFRKKSMAAHPDRNPGLPEKAQEFQDIVQAYRILSDPERKRRYDETGDVSDGPNNLHAVLLSTLTACFQQVVGQIMQQGRSPLDHDLVDIMQQWLRGQNGNLHKQKEQARQAADKFRKLAERFSVQGEEPNLLAEVAAWELAQLEQSQQRADATIQRHLEALEYLRKCSFRRDERAAFASLHTAGIGYSSVWTQH